MKAVLLVLLLAALPAAADERARIAAERHAVEQQFAADETECRERFAVTACLDDAKAKRRGALAELKRQELVLDDAERKRKAADRLLAVERRRAEAAARAEAPPAVVKPPRGAAPPAAIASRPAPVPHTPPVPDEQAAARRAAQAQKLRDEAAEDRRQIQLREEERARKGKPVTPLPVPPEAASGARR